MQTRIKKSTPVMVYRYIKDSMSSDPVTVWGPLPAGQALKHISTSSGTIAVRVESAPGHEHEGANVYFIGDRVYAQTPDTY